MKLRILNSFPVVVTSWVGFSNPFMLCGQEAGRSWMNFEGGDDQTLDL